MAEKQFRGIFTIPPTPFNPDETLDRKGLDSILSFTVDAGANGIVMPDMASEYQAHDDGERRLMAERAVVISNGRIPVVAGVIGVTTSHSIALGRQTWHGPPRSRGTRPIAGRHLRPDDLAGVASGTKIR